jgi:hypothetical protein
MMPQRIMNEAHHFLSSPLGLTRQLISSGPGEAVTLKGCFSSAGPSPKIGGGRKKSLSSPLVLDRGEFLTLLALFSFVGFFHVFSLS